MKGFLSKSFSIMVWEVLLLALIFLSFGFVWGSHWSAPVAVPVKAEAGFTQADGSKVLAVVPPAQAAGSSAQPQQMLPMGDKATGIVGLDVQPTGPMTFKKPPQRAAPAASSAPSSQASTSAATPAPTAASGEWDSLPEAPDKFLADCNRFLQCPVVHVDLTLAVQPDGSQRVIASAKDGSVLAGYDIPLVAPLVVHEHPQAAGLIYDSRHALGGFYDRDWGPVRWGLEVKRDPTLGIEEAAKIGYRW